MKLHGKTPPSPSAARGGPASRSPGAASGKRLSREKRKKQRWPLAARARSWRPRPTTPARAGSCPLHAGRPALPIIIIIIPPKRNRGFALCLRSAHTPFRATTTPPRSPAALLCCCSSCSCCARRPRQAKPQPLPSEHLPARRKEARARHEADRACPPPPPAASSTSASSRDPPSPASSSLAICSVLSLDIYRAFLSLHPPPAPQPTSRFLLASCPACRLQKPLLACLFAPCLSLFLSFCSNCSSHSSRRKKHAVEQRARPPVRRLDIATGTRCTCTELLRTPPVLASSS